MQLYIYWNPSPDAFSLGLFSIQWYGIMWGLGLLSTLFIGTHVFRALNRDEEKLTILIQYIFVGGVIGARLAHVIFYQWDFYSQHLLEILAVWKGGLASHGGVVGGFVGLFTFCRVHKDYPLFWTVDHVVLGVMLLAGLIRFGNLMNSEIVGEPTNVPWAFVFQQVDNVPRHPVVLYESIVYIILQGVMLLLFQKYRDSKPGLYITLFLIVVFSVRFTLEFFKMPDGGMVLGVISKTQALNLPFIITGVVIGILTLQGRLKYSTPANV